MDIRLVTGAAGFLGKQLTLEILYRHPADRVLAIVHSTDGSDLREWLSARRSRVDALELVHGDIEVPDCGFDQETLNRLASAQVHIYHAAARYDLADQNPAADTAINVNGTANVLRLAERIGARSFAHISSVVVAGDFHGIWTEEHMNEARNWPSSYASSKHSAEQLVRESCVPSRTIHRLGILVGDQNTGSYFKEDGMYSFFEAIRRIDRAMPRELPMPVFGWGAVPLCPIDYAARAVAALSAKPVDGLTVNHVFEDEVLRSDDIMRLVFAAAGREKTFEMSWAGHVLQAVEERSKHDTVLADLQNEVLTVFADIGVPRYLMQELQQSTQFSNAQTAERLRLLGIHSPSFEEYSSRIWHGWLAHRTRALKDRRRDFFRGKRVLMTGGSSGIGAGMVRRMLELGVDSITVLGRSPERLAVSLGSHSASERVQYVPCDLLQPESVAAAVEQLVAEGEWIDVLVLSAGLSVHRRLLDMSDDLNELVRMTQVNFLSAIHLIRGVVPLMETRKDATVVTLSTIGTQVDVPGFGIYSATKAALDQVFAVLPSELSGAGIRFCSVRLPLVKTAMTDANVRLRQVPMLSVGRAVELVLAATVIGKPTSGTWLGTVFEVLRTIRPSLAMSVSSIGWRSYLRVPYFARLFDAYLRTSKI